VRIFRSAWRAGFTSLLVPSTYRANYVLDYATLRTLPGSHRKMQVLLLIKLCAQKVPKNKNIPGKIYINKRANLFE
jgi:hypothetical protein